MQVSGPVVVAGDAEGVLCDLVQLRGKAPAINEIAKEVALHLAPQGRDLAGLHLWGERNTTADHLSRIQEDGWTSHLDWVLHSAVERDVPIIADWNLSDLSLKTNCSANTNNTLPSSPPPSPYAGLCHAHSNGRCSQDLYLGVELMRLGGGGDPRNGQGADPLVCLLKRNWELIPNGHRLFAFVGDDPHSNLKTWELIPRRGS